MTKKTAASMIINDTNLTHKAMRALHAFFDDPDDSTRSVASEGLRLLGVQSRVIASQTNRAAVIVATAKHMNLSGEALAPMWKELTGESAQRFLPSPQGVAADQAA